MKKMILLVLLVLLFTMIVVPLLFVAFYNEGDPESIENKIKLEIDPNKNVIVTVYRTKSNTIEPYPLEEYVRGVIAAEMPINFELEALKAQALAARTYIVKKIIDKDFTDAANGAMVMDTIKDQVYKSDDELKKLWGYNYQENISKLNQAINETSGQVITYQGLPITALYFSTSNGYTENSEDYWQKEVPYLRSVESPWDFSSPKFQTSKNVSFSEIKSQLNVNTSIAASLNQQWIQILETTEGKRVKKIKVDDKTFSGREIREAFDLNSSSFTMELTENGIIFHTKGYGHGVGMSQYGANGMAMERKSAEEIIKYYYTGVEITNIEKWLKPKSL